MKEENDKKFARKRFTINEKKKILSYHDENIKCTQKEMSKKFDVPLGTVNSILRNKDYIKGLEGNIKTKSLKNNFKTKIFDDKLYEWFALKRKRT